MSWYCKNCSLLLPDSDDKCIGCGDERSSESEQPCATCNDDPEVCATVPGLRHCEAANRSREKDWRTLVREAKPLLLRAWEKSGEGAFGPIAQALNHLDSALSGTPVSARAAVIEECAKVAEEEYRHYSGAVAGAYADVADRIRRLARTSAAVERTASKEER